MRRPTTTATPEITSAFNLLDHRTPLGKVIDVALLALNLVFVAIFAAETYPHSPGTDALLWDLEVVIAAVFLAECVLRLYGARNRVAEFSTATRGSICWRYCRRCSSSSHRCPRWCSTSASFAWSVWCVFCGSTASRDAESFFGTVSDNTLRAVKLPLTVLVIFFVSAGLFYSVEHTANPAVNTFGDASHCKACGHVIYQEFDSRG